MKNRFRVFHLAAICVALFLTGAARMSGQNGQALRITTGPILEEVTSDSAVIAWSTNMQGSTNVMYGSDPRNLSRLAEAPWGANGDTHRVKIQNLRRTRPIFSVSKLVKHARDMVIPPGISSHPF